MSVISSTTVSFDMNIPIAIIGAGACGLTAAITAARQGAEVYVFEKDAQIGGATAMSYGAICAAGTKIQAEVGIQDTGENLAEDIMTAARGKTDENLAKLMAEESGATVDWMIDDLGFDLTVEANWTGFGHRCPRLHATPNRSGVELVAMLLNAAESAGVTLITQSHVKELVIDAETSEVIGFSYESPDGKMRIKCEALILASSGFGANETLVEKHIPNMAGAKFYGCEGHSGDAIIWGEALGAQMDDLAAHQGLGTLANPECFIVPHTLLIDGGVQINALGMRFENELIDISGQAARIIKEPDAVSWVVYDHNGHEKAKRIFAEYRDAEIMKPFKFADDFKTLAGLMKIDGKTFTQTMISIEKMRETGETGPFGRIFNKDANLSPPFYAVRTTGALFHTQGGLCVDYQARVKKSDGTSFSTLFAGGGAARSISGPAQWGYLPGSGLMSAVTLGRIAGRAAVRVIAN